MKRWIPIGLFSILAAACSGQPDVTSPAPTVVPRADQVSEYASDAPPAQLAFEDWTNEDIAAQIETALDGPATIIATGTIVETLEISGDDWRVTGPTSNDGISSDSPAMVVRGNIDNGWVTYGSVSDITRVDSALSSALFRETASLRSTWVPHLPNRNGAFSPSFLSTNMLRTVLVDLVNDIRTSSNIETTLAEADRIAVVPGTEFSSLTLERRGSRIELTTPEGLTLSITSGVADSELLGAPDPRDVLTRPLLIASTSFPEHCVSPIIEAGILAENGPILCETDDQYAELQQWFKISFTGSGRRDEAQGKDE
jgi:hypothetical protein